MRGYASSYKNYRVKSGKIYAIYKENRWEQAGTGIINLTTHTDAYKIVLNKEYLIKRSLKNEEIVALNAAECKHITKTSHETNEKKNFYLLRHFEFVSLKSHQLRNNPTLLCLFSFAFKMYFIYFAIGRCSCCFYVNFQSFLVFADIDMHVQTTPMCEFERF